MKNQNFYIYLAVFLVCNLVSSQNLAQDEEGFSNIVVPSTLFNLDLTNKVATFDFINDYGLKSGNDFLYGIQIKGKVENDAGTIFTKEKIASNSSIWFLLAHSWRPQIKSNTKELPKIISKKNSLSIELQSKKEALNLYVKSIDEDLARKNSLIGKLKEKSNISENIIDIELLEGYIKTVNEGYKLVLAERKTKNEALEENEQKEDLKDIKKLINQANSYYGKITSYLAIMLNIRMEIKAMNDKFNNFDKTINYIKTRNLVFFRSGFNGSSFEYDLNPETTTIDERFKEITFNGWQAEIGYNYNKRLTFLGLSVSSTYMIHLEDLDDTTYTLKISDNNITDGDFSTTKTIKAMSGDFEKFTRTSLNIDLSRVIRVNKRDSLYLSAYTFLRKRFYSSSASLKNNVVYGFGLNAINSKKGSLLGGLFVQTKDLFGVNDNKSLGLGNRITFGIVAKASFKATSVRD